MVTFSEAARNQIRLALCAATAENPVISGLLARVGLNGIPQRRIGRAFRRRFCNADGPEDDPPQFTGGQCVGVQYDISGQNSFPGNPGPFTFSARASGAILRIFVKSPNIIAADTTAGEVNLTNPSPFAPVPEDIRNIVVSRVDGLPDNCGDLPGPVYEPIPSVEVDIDIDYTNNNNVDVNLTGVLTIFAPVFSPVFSPSFPFRLELPDFSFSGEIGIDGEISLNPEINLGFGLTVNVGEGGQGGEPPDPVTPVIVGCIVFSSSIDGKFVGRIAQGQNPDIWIPRLGSVNFLHRLGDSTAWCNDISVKVNPCWIPAPAPGWALRVNGTPALGVEWEIISIYGRPPAP